MPVTFRRGTPSVSPYNVQGNTLAEIQEYINRHGPVDPNESRRYAGSCRCTLDISIGSNDMGVESEAAGRRWRATARFTGGRVTDECAITVPQLAGGDSLSSAARNEWDRFAAATRTHEDGHVDSYRELAAEVVAELNALTGEGDGRDARNAERAAQRALVQAFQRSYTEATLRRRINQNAASYDSRTRHGATQGAVLNLRIA